MSKIKAEDIHGKDQIDAYAQQAIPHSAEYQEHASLRHAAADNKAAIVAGFELSAG